MLNISTDPHHNTAHPDLLMNYLGMHLADWVVLAGYFLLILFIGLWSATKVNDAADYFMGGRRFGKIFMMFFAFGSGTSSEQANAVVAGTWRAGLAGIWWQFLWLPATPFYWIIAPILRRIRALTTADFFGHRFGPKTAVLYSFYGIIISVVFIAGGLYSSGKMINALTGNALEEYAAENKRFVPTIVYDVVPVDTENARDAPAEPATEDMAWQVKWRPVYGYEYAILVMTILFVSYGMAGGLGAAIITDFIQGVLTVTFSVLLLPFVFSQIGGFGALGDHEQLKEGMFHFVADSGVASTLGKDPITFFYVCVLSLTALTGIIVQPHIMGVCGAGKTEYEGRFGFTVGNFLKRLCTVAWTFTGLACIAWYLGGASPLVSGQADDPVPYAELKMTDEDREEFDSLPQEERERILYSAMQLKARSAEEFQALPKAEREWIDTKDKQFADELFGRAAYDVLPTIAPGLIGLLLASLLAAVMSTCDAQMVVSSGLFTENIYKSHFVKGRSDRHYVWVGRIAGLLIVLAALLLQATFTDVVQALKVMVKTPAAIGISMWFGIFWRRWNTRSVWVSTVCAALAWYVVAYHASLLYKVTPEFARSTVFKSDVAMFDLYQSICYLGAGVVGGVLTALLTPPEEEEKLNTFFTLLRTPVKADEEVPGPCMLPVNNTEQEPVIRIGGFQFPKPTRLGVGGFVIAWILVLIIVGFTKLLSMLV